MKAPVVRFPSPAAPRPLYVPGRVRRLSFLRMRLEVWLRVVAWKWRTRGRRVVGGS